jgi:7,8-dihydropterin-6-yl-methyl-4-(beta-D-ribofuranosyl)aminobenzene 5'-phosphate synthase
MKAIALFCVLELAGFGNAAERVKSAHIRILSTMLADDDGFGEWGFAALVEADGHRILFDTGAHPDTVLRNGRLLKVDLSNVEEVFISHNHLDHTAGLITLRREYSKTNPKALSKAHVAKGIFIPRLSGGRRSNAMIGFRTEYEALGGTFVVHDQATELYPGIWLTGPVPRKYPERNWSGSGTLDLPGSPEDNLPEDQSLILDTDKGLVLISGCGHAGIINTLEFTRAKVRTAPVYAAFGGFHLFAASDETLDWTAGKLSEFGVQNLVGAHCTGIEATYRLREKLGLNRKTAVVGAVGASFDLDKGIEPGSIAK